MGKRQKRMRGRSEEKEEGALKFGKPLESSTVYYQGHVTANTRRWQPAIQTARQSEGLGMMLRWREFAYFFNSSRSNYSSCYCIEWLCTFITAADPLDRYLDEDRERGRCYLTSLEQQTDLQLSENSRFETFAKSKTKQGCTEADQPFELNQVGTMGDKTIIIIGCKIGSHLQEIRKDRKSPEGVDVADRRQDLFGGEEDHDLHRPFALAQTSSFRDGKSQKSVDTM